MWVIMYAVAPHTMIVRRGSRDPRTIVIIVRRGCCPPRTIIRSIVRTVVRRGCRPTHYKFYGKGTASFVGRCPLVTFVMTPICATMFAYVLDIMEYKVIFVIQTFTFRLLRLNGVAITLS